MQVTQNDYTLTISEAAAMLGGTEKAVERLIFTARLDAVRVKGERGHEFRIRPDDILAQKSDLERRVADFDADAPPRKREAEAPRPLEPEATVSAPDKAPSLTTVVPEVAAASAPVAWTVSLPISGPASASPCPKPSGADTHPEPCEHEDRSGQHTALKWEEPRLLIEFEHLPTTEVVDESAEAALPKLEWDPTPLTTPEATTAFAEAISAATIVGPEEPLPVRLPLAHVPAEAFHPGIALPEPAPEAAIARPYIRPDAAAPGVAAAHSLCSPGAAPKTSHDSASFDRAVAEALAATTAFVGPDESPGAAWVRNAIDWASDDDAALAARQHPHAADPETDSADVEFPELADEALSVESNGKSRRGVLAEGLKRIGSLLSFRK